MDEAYWARQLPVVVTKPSSSKEELRTGLIVAGAFFIGFLGWAGLTPLDAGAVSQGVVAVSGSRQVVQHREGGIVIGLNVVEGQAVKVGDLLAQISQSSVVADERGLSGEVITLLAQRARLQSELSGGGAMVEPPEFATLNAEDRAIAIEAMRGQRILKNARRESLASQRAVLRQRAQQSAAQIGASHHQIDANREQQRLIQQELTGLKELAGRGFVSTNRIRAMERDAAQLDGNYGALHSDIARANEAIGEMNMQKASLERQKVEDVAGQLRDLQLRLDEIQPKLAAAREQLARSQIRATATGHVVNMKVHTVGGVIAPGEILMEIVPNNRALVIQLKTPPTEADELKIGMAAQVRFSSLHDRNLPILNGSVSRISADSLEDERTGTRYFTMEVSVPPSELEKINRTHGENAIRAGIPAEIVIPLRKRTALGYLLEPLSKMSWLAGRER